jgi:hypothetical protein
VEEQRKHYKDGDRKNDISGHGHIHSEPKQKRTKRKFQAGSLYFGKVAYKETDPCYDEK